MRLILAAGLIATTALAQPAAAPDTGPNSPRAKLIAADANEDGKWDQPE